METGKQFWVVVADESRAIVYGRDTRKGPLQELFVLENPDGRKKAGELVTDRSGRAFDSGGQGRHGMAKEKNGPREHVAEAFARQIAARIGKETHSGNCRDYALIAAPRFLGLLRDALATHSQLAPSKTVDKEVVGKDVAFLKKLLDA